MDIKEINEIGKQYLEKIEVIRKRHAQAAERYLRRLDDFKIAQIRSSIKNLAKKL